MAGRDERGGTSGPEPRRWRGRRRAVAQVAAMAAKLGACASRRASVASPDAPGDFHEGARLPTEPLNAPAVSRPVAPAAAVVLWRRSPGLEIHWVQRRDELAYLGGFHAFPGGRVNRADRAVPVSNLEAAESAPAWRAATNA